MKSTIRKQTYLAIYRLLNNQTPLSTDCGALCDAACCKTNEENMGIYLLPGEDKVFTRKESWLSWESENAEDYDFPDSWSGKIHFIRCKNAPHCPRNLRPLQCRFFPLAPHFLESGNLVLILCDLELPYCCPLISNEMNLEPSFIQTVYTVWNRLIKDPLIFDLVTYDSSFRYDDELHIVYPS